MTSETEEKKSLSLDKFDSWQWLAAEIARRAGGEA